MPSRANVRRAPWEIDSSELRETVAIVANVGDQTESGYVAPMPVVIADGLPAKVEQTSFTERFATERVEALLTHRVTLRYLPNIERSMHVLWNGRRLEIAELDNVGNRDHKLVLECAEIA